MTDDERAAPDSLGAKIRGLFEDEGSVRDGSDKVESDTGTHVPSSADEPAPAAPKRPTDPPF